MEINKLNIHLLSACSCSFINLQTLQAELEDKVLTIIHIFLITKFGNLQFPLKISWSEI